MVRWLGGSLLAIAFCLGTAPVVAARETIAPPLGSGQPLILESEMTGTDPGGRTGYSVALSDDGTTALVGEPRGDCLPSGLPCGAARVLVRNGGTWVEQARLIPSDRPLDGLFGWSVTLSGDGSIALVGAPCYETSCNAAFVFVFVRNGQSWSEVQKLVPSDAPARFFGSSVDLSRDGSVALIGGSQADCGGFVCGAAYIFNRNGVSWIETARVSPPDLIGGDNFGHSVALSDDGTIALIGALLGTHAGQLIGTAYVYVASGATWTQEQKLTAGDPGFLDQFGTSVSLSSDGSTALIGAPYQDCVIAAECGAAYVFARSGGAWTQSAKLAGGAGVKFGRAVALSGDARHLLVGQDRFNYDSECCGAARLFVESNGSWVEKQLLVTQPASFESWAVALSENADRALVGTPISNAPGNPGHAFLFGTTSPIDVPVAGGAGLAVLAGALAMLGAAMLRARRNCPR